MPKQRTCLDCQNHAIEQGYDSTMEDPGMPDVLLCQIADETEVWEDILETENPAKDCKFFKPIIADACGFCRKQIGIPRYLCEHQLNHWYSGDPIAICSSTCSDALDAQWMKETLDD